MISVYRYTIGTTLLFALAYLASSTSTAQAIEGCKVKIDKKNGTILFSAKSVGPTPLWGDAAGLEVNAFADLGCISDGIAKGCALGIQGAPVRITPPELCTLYVDDGVTSCTAYIKGCTPGVRAESGDVSPVGTVSAYAGTTAPTGWLLCDGAEIDRVTYADLFAVIGTLHGSGDSVSTFNLPDYRGRFLRGVDAGEGRDPDAGIRNAMNPGGAIGDEVGTLQGDAFASHSHSIRGGTTALQPLASGGQPYGSTVFNGNASGVVLNTGGSETRPTNASVNYILKF